MQTKTHYTKVFSITLRCILKASLGKMIDFPDQQKKVNIILKKQPFFAGFHFDKCISSLSLSGQPNDIKVALDVSNIPHLDEKNEVKGS